MGREVEEVMREFAPTWGLWTGEGRSGMEQRSLVVWR